MPSKIFSAAIAGLDAKLVDVEVEVSPGLKSFSIVGLPDKAVEESKERIGSAIASSRLASPFSRPLRTLVNLAPADLKKEGSLYDLPIALAFLIASKQTSFDEHTRMFLGELSLDGTLRPMKGALSFALLAKQKGLKEIILPRPNAPEAALIKGIDVIGVESLREALEHLEGRTIAAPTINHLTPAIQNSNHIDIGWVQGQEYAKRALEITAAGAHNLFFFGPPGGGKSLMAKALPSILPSLTFDEAVEVTKIHSIAGMLPEHQPMVNARPFRSPHHIVSDVALIGGGNPPKPGEITLAHRGVLFMDEFPEFHRDVLEALRQPIEDGVITVSRARHQYTFPSRFMLVAASNPCPCGYLNSPEKPCTCSPSAIAMYRRKLSGPLMDRIDMFVEVPAVKYDKLVGQANSTQGEIIRKKVEAARAIQHERFAQDGIATNAEMQIPQIQKYCTHDAPSQEILKKYVDSGTLSARGYHRVLKVARTIADLAGSENILRDHIAEALMYRLRS